jgi:hypothetical protein
MYHILIYRTIESRIKRHFLRASPHWKEIRSAVPHIWSSVVTCGTYSETEKYTANSSILGFPLEPLHRNAFAIARRQSELFQTPFDEWTDNRIGIKLDTELFEAD